MPSRFSTAQVSLHWLTAFAVLAQFLNDGAIGAAFRATMRKAAEIPGGWLVTAHVVGGIAILAFTLWRIGLRIVHGAPAAPASEPRPLRLVAAATHGLLYLLLLLLPLTGLAAWFGEIRAAGGLHALLTTALLVLVGLHVAGALYQQLVLRSDVLARMLPARTIR